MRRWLILVGALGGMAIIVAWEICFFSSYVVSDQNNYSYTNNEYGAARCLVKVILTPLIWLDDIVEGHHDAVIAITTVAVAVFTATLWWATNRLWQTSQEHSLHLEGSVKAAADAATAATAQVGELKRSADATERALTEYERPWIFLEGARITLRDSSGWTTTPDGRRVENPRIPNDWFITLKFKNVGRMPAIIYGVLAKIENKATLPDISNYEGNIIHLICPGTIAAGDAADTNSVGPAPGRQGELVFFGRITYRELNGKEHHTGFALDVAPHMAAFVRHPNDAYDYYD